jgi:outer membrane immunogenic protein
MLVRIVVLACALLGVSPPASAQQDWLGVFVGAQIGYSSDHIGVSGSPLAEVGGHNRVGSLIGGVHGGVHLLQQGTFIAGFVGDLNLLNADTTRSWAQSTTSVIDACGDGCFVETAMNTSVRVSVGVDWKASLRGKAGFLATPRPCTQFFLDAGLEQ